MAIEPTSPNPPVPPTPRRPTLDDGNIFEHQGYRFRVRFEPDQDHGPPWVENDGHGMVSDWTTREKRPGERVLVTDRNSRRYYDIAATLKIARRDGWGTADGRRDGESLRAYAARAVDADFEYLRGWCTDQWQYVGVIVSWHDADDSEDMAESLWGVESLNEYPTEIAYELADQLLTRIEVANPDVVRSEN